MTEVAAFLGTAPADTIFYVINAAGRMADWRHFNLWDAYYAVPLIFAYGVLQQDAVQLAAFGRLLVGTCDHLAGFELTDVEVDNAAVSAVLGVTHFANLAHRFRTDCRVKGTQYEIGDLDLRAVDKYMLAANYKRTPQLLASGVMAWVYIYAGGR